MFNRKTRKRRLSDSEIKKKIGSMQREDAGEEPAEDDEELVFDEVTDVVDFAVKQTRSVSKACVDATRDVVDKIDKLAAKIEEKKA